MEGDYSDMTDFNTKLGPGALADSSRSPYGIPLSIWEDVNYYVDQIAEVPPIITTGLTFFVLDFQELHTCALRWQKRTFPDMIALSRFIYDYGAGTVVPIYGQLKNIVNKIDNVQSSQIYKEQFHLIMDQLLNSVSGSEDLAASIAVDIAEFAETTNNVKFQLTKKAGANRYKSALDVNPTDEVLRIFQALSKLPVLIQSLKHSPLSKIQYIRGSLLAIKEDLQEIKENYSVNFAADNPLLTTFGIDLAKEEWRQAADEVYGFANKDWTLA